MTGKFARAIEALFRRAESRPVPAPPPVTQNAKPAPKDRATRRMEWFAAFVETRVMPLLDDAARLARRHGIAASSQALRENGRLVAELTLVIPGLPPHARPPRLIVYLADSEPPLMVEYTGTFPGIGATGGFGAQVDYIQVHSNELEDKILEFVDLATGGGTRLIEFPR